MSDVMEISRMNRLFNNGFIIKSYMEQSNYDGDENYFGIGRYITWPLADFADEISISLTNEAWNRWFGYCDERLYAVPDLDYLQRYAKHCSQLNIPIFCMQIESFVPIVTSSVQLPVETVLGFEVADVDMQTSAMHEEIMINSEDSADPFLSVREQLNRYGLAESIEAVQHYLDLRNEWIALGYDMEEYYSAAVVRLSIVSLEAER